jgi:uncharacterized protein (UPF0333 family)
MNVWNPFFRFALRGRHLSRGQILLEYAIIAGILLAAVAVLSIFLYTFRENGDRILNLVSAEYP